MERIRVKKNQKGQGLLEFALVLPILLLVILGIFAFGHMFFAYTTVVSASREAARYGAVVGVGQSGVPRYQDCAGIRASAERIGTFVGVTATETINGFDGEDPGIYIGYDTGPTTTAYDDCPVGGTGPSMVELGDRILVRVSIDYEPIVPLLNLPSFPLSATTARTIIKDVAVGTAPPAESVCETSAIDLDLLWFEDPDSGSSLIPPYELTVGQVTFPNVQLTTSDNEPSPPGRIYIYDRQAYLDHPRGAPICDFAPPTNEGNTACNLIYPEISVENADGEGGYDVVIDYVPPAPDADSCYLPTTYVAHIDVVPAETEIQALNVVPMPYVFGANVRVNVTVRTITPGGGQPVGQVKVFTLGGGHRNLDCTFNSPPLPVPADPWAAEFSGYCDLGNRWEEGQTYYINATFTGAEGRYVNSDASPLFSPEIGMPYTIPTRPIDQAQWCRDFGPSVGGINFASDAFSVDVTNNRGVGLTLTSVSLNWPHPGTISGVPFLNSIRFGDAIWTIDPGIAPTSYTASGLNTLMPSGNTWSLRAGYNTQIAPGDYAATLIFTGQDRLGETKTCPVQVTKKKPN